MSAQSDTSIGCCHDTELRRKARKKHMDLIKGFVVLLILLGIIPLLIGILCSVPIKRSISQNIIFVYLLGIMVLVAICEALSVPMTLMKRSFTDFLYAYNCYPRFTYYHLVKNKATFHKHLFSPNTNPLKFMLIFSSGKLRPNSS